MSGHWIAFGWLLVGIGFVSLWIARRQKRVDAITYAVVLLGLAAGMLVLAVGQGWQKYQSHTAGTQIRNELNDIGSEKKRVRGRLQTLQERIRVNKGASEASALQEERKAISRDAQALKERAVATQSEFNDARRARAFRDLLTFVCALAIAILAVVGRVCISRTQRKRIAERNASLRAQGIDPTVPSERVRQLAHAGKKIAAIKIYCEETGTWPQEAKHVVESYLDGRRGDV
jgi:hypothetical protein